MILIFVSIVLSSLLIACFKVFEQFKLQAKAAITVNYFVASGIGLMVGFDDLQKMDLLQQAWIPYTLGFGILFIFVFNLVAIGVKQAGLVPVSISQKMSLILPLLLGILWYHDGLSTLKVIGMVIALVAIYFSSKKEETANAPIGGKFILLAIFLGSGLVDVCIKISQEQFGSEVPFELLLVFIFGAAGVIGLIQLLVQKIRISFKDLVGGFSLGLLNFFSTYVLMSALSQPGFESSYVFAINNIGIILFNSAFASFFYKEKLSRINQFGILLALLAIAFIQLGR